MGYYHLNNLSKFDIERGGLHLDAEWTKNRKEGFQPLSSSLIERLQAFAESGEPVLLYEKFYSRRDAKQKTPTNPLLYVPSHTARAFDKDLESAGIPKQAPGGEVDFHACRVAYINLVLESGVCVKEA